MVAALVGIFLYGERHNLLKILGIIAVLAAIVILNLPRRAPVKKAPAPLSEQKEEAVPEPLDEEELAEAQQQMDGKRWTIMSCGGVSGAYSGGVWNFRRV